MLINVIASVGAVYKFRNTILVIFRSPHPPSVMPLCPKDKPKRNTKNRPLPP